MKHLARLFSLVILVSAGLFIASCGSDPTATSDEETQLNKFKSTWNLSSANDGTDRTSDYTAMTTTFSGTFSTGGTYNFASTATSWPPVSPWKKDGTWKFNSTSVLTKIVRIDDGQEMEYAFSNGDKTLTISFNYTGTGFNNNRVNSVAGDWTFVFTKP